MSVANKTELKEFDVCLVRNDWIDQKYKQIRCKIIGFQWHGRVQFAKVKWLTKDAKKLIDECGNLFPLDELKKI